MRCFFCFVILAGFWPASAQVPSSPEVILTRAQDFFDKNDFEQAILVLNELHRQSSKPDSLSISAYLLKAQALERLGHYPEARTCTDTILSWYEQNEQSLPPVLYPATLHRRAAIANRMGNYRKALAEGLKGKSRLEKIKPAPSLLTINFLMVIGNSYYRLYQTDSSLYYEEKTLELSKRMYGPEHRNVARALNNLSNSYRDLRQYERALNYLEEAIAIEKKLDSEDNLSLQFLYYNKGLNLQSIGKPREAIRSFEQARRLTEMHLPGHHYLADYFKKIGDCYLNLGEISQARSYYEEGLTFLKSQPQIHYELAQMWHAYAQVFERDKEYGKATSYVDSALVVARVQLGDDHPWLATYWSDRAYYCTFRGHYAEAHRNVQSALDVLGYHEDLDPQTAIAKNIFYFALGIAGYVSLQQYKSDGDKSLLEQALTYYDQSMAVLQELRQGMHDESSRHQLSSETIKIYEHAVEVCYNLFEETGDSEYIKHALQISENSRKSTVLEALLSDQTEGFPGVPNDVTLRENYLHRQINYLSEYIHQTKLSESYSDSLLHALEDSLFTVRHDLYTFLDTLQRNHPRYHAHKYASKPLEVDVLQKELGKDQIILEFFDADSMIFLFALNQVEIKMLEIPRDEQLASTIQQFVDHLGNRDSVLSDPERSLAKLGRSSQYLYRELLHEALQLRGNALLVIPDGLEAKLVFDILATEPIDGEDPTLWPYLFRRYKVNYAQSIHTWREQLTHQGETPYRFAGFSPSYPATSFNPEDTAWENWYVSIERSEVAYLPGAREEIREIEKIMRGQMFRDSQACEKHFVENAGLFRILHISAHAFADEREPARSHFLFADCQDTLYDHKLTATEICRLDLHADLAVLSACHTGSGPVRRGEGIMSLGRAFSFAGVPSTLLGMWKLPDQSTARLLPHFYTHLNKGLQKHEALNRARMDYLQNTNIKDLKHPYFWSGIILYGRDNPIESDLSSPNVIWVLVIFLFLLPVIYFYRRSRGGRNNARVIIDE